MSRWRQRRSLLYCMYINENKDFVVSILHGAQQNFDGWEPALGSFVIAWRGLMMWKRRKMFHETMIDDSHDSRLLQYHLYAKGWGGIIRPELLLYLWLLKSSPGARHCSSWYCVTLSRHPPLRIANTPILFLFPHLPSGLWLPRLRTVRTAVWSLKNLQFPVTHRYRTVICWIPDISWLLSSSF